MKPKPPIIDVFTQSADDENEDVRFTFGEREGLIGIEVNGGDMIFVPKETIQDLFMVLEGFDWGQHYSRRAQPDMFDESLS